MDTAVDEKKLKELVSELVKRVMVISGVQGA